ncbi:hypothetical protein DPEC_G00277650 [Dallia pectoralis]|uniref:Uncharacterized protein n=1 Tax=Dallia pectoralis TaxID=75939 RepID=A0ACC2FLT9_DALPE|nr:hypothetical protein DPEC_G00277650 [Dallia pectoralis]
MLASQREWNFSLLRHVCLESNAWAPCKTIQSNFFPKLSPPNPPPDTAAANEAPPPSPTQGTGQSPANIALVRRGQDCPQEEPQRGTNKPRTSQHHNYIQWCPTYC